MSFVCWCLVVDQPRANNCTVTRLFEQRDRVMSAKITAVMLKNNTEAHIV